MATGVAWYRNHLVLLLVLLVKEWQQRQSPCRNAVTLAFLVERLSTRVEGQRSVVRLVFHDGLQTS